MVDSGRCFETLRNHSIHAIPTLHTRNFRNQRDLSHCHKFDGWAITTRDNKDFAELERLGVATVSCNEANHLNGKLPTALGKIDFVVSDDDKWLMEMTQHNWVNLEILLEKCCAQQMMLAMNCLELDSSNTKTPLKMSMAAMMKMQMVDKKKMMSSRVPESCSWVLYSDCTAATELAAMF